MCTVHKFKNSNSDNSSNTESQIRICTKYNFLNLHKREAQLLLSNHMTCYVS